MQNTCPCGRKLAKASEGADGREEVGSEGTNAVKINSIETPGLEQGAGEKCRYLRYAGSRKEGKQWV